MKLLSGKLLILLIVIVSSLSGCYYDDETNILNGFDSRGMWNYFPSSFYELLQDESKNVSYVINWEGDEKSSCDTLSNESVWIKVSRFNDFILNVSYQTDETYCEGKIKDDTEICDDGFCTVPVTITPDDKIQVDSEYIDQENKEMIENTPILLSSITFNKEYVENNLELIETDSRYLYRALYKIKNFEQDINNINLKKALNIENDFDHVKMIYENENKQCSVSFVATNGVVVSITIGG